MEKLRVGIIGCGGIAKWKHLPNLALIPEIELVGFCDLIEERVREAADKYGAPGAKVCVDYKELLADESIAVVHVLTPNRMHSVISIDAMRAGKNVLCEKPMAKTAAEAKEMLKVAKETGKRLYIGYQSRQYAASRVLKTMCRADELGDIYYAEALSLRRRGVPGWGVFLDEYEQGGGPLIDIGTHTLDMTLWLLDNYEPRYVVGSVYHKLANVPGAGDWDPAKFQVEDSAFGTIVMKNGATVCLKSSWALNIPEPQDGRLLLCGTKAGAEWSGGTLRINGRRDGEMYIDEPDLTTELLLRDGAVMSAEYCEMRRWYDCLVYGKEQIVRPEQTVVVSQILEAIYESGKSGQPIYF